jgi:predicted SprT family Zn-dependent metalloprotease
MRKMYKKVIIKNSKLRVIITHVRAVAQLRAHMYGTKHVHAIAHMYTCNCTLTRPSAIAQLHIHMQLHILVQLQR